MKTLIRRTAVVAVAAAAMLLNAHAGYCINPQPLPPGHHPHPTAQAVYLVLSLLHRTAYSG